MKKIVYTAVMLTAFHFASQAQSHDQTKPKESSKKEHVNPDGTAAADSKAAPAPNKVEKNAEAAPASSNNAADQKAPTSSKDHGAQPKTKTKSASTEPAKVEKK